MSPHRGYPLGALFVLIAASAVLVAGIAPLVRLLVRGEAEDWASVLISVSVGLLCGLLIGATLGLLQFRRLLGLGLGSAAGAIIGAAGGGMAVLPASQLLTAAIPVAVGSALVVGVALLMRRTA